MVHLIAGVAVFLCMIFTGAAFYITLVEHPAGLSCGTEVAARQWGRLHTVRSALGLAASIVCLYALAHI